MSGKGKQNKEIAEINIKSAWWGSPKGRTVTLLELSDPKYDPWIIYKAYSPDRNHRNQNDFNQRIRRLFRDLFAHYYILHHLESGHLFWLKYDPSLIVQDNKKWYRIKPNKKLHDIIHTKISEFGEVKIAKEPWSVPNATVNRI